MEAGVKSFCTRLPVKIMLHYLFSVMLQALRRVLFCQLLTHGNYCGVSRPIWPNPRRRYPLGLFVGLADQLPPVDELDRACLIHDIECKLAHGSWEKRLQTDRWLLQRLAKLKPHGLLQHLYRLACWGFYALFFFAVHGLKMRGLVPRTVFFKGDLAKHKKELVRIRKLHADTFRINN